MIVFGSRYLAKGKHRAQTQQALSFTIAQGPVHMEEGPLSTIFIMGSFRLGGPYLRLYLCSCLMRGVRSPCQRARLHEGPCRAILEHPVFHVCLLASLSSLIYIPGTHRDQEGQALYEQDPEGAHTTFASESLQWEARSLCRPLFSSLCEGPLPHTSQGFHEGDGLTWKECIGPRRYHTAIGLSAKAV